MTGPRLSIIPARACTDRALKPRDLQVLCVLGRHTDELGWCRKSQVKMAAEMGCARATVFEAIERLVKAGYLERHVQEEDSGRDSPHVYRVVLDPTHPDPGAIPAEDDSDLAADTPADIPAPPAGMSAPPAGPGPAPKNDPLRTIEREPGREDREEGQPAIAACREDAKAIERAFEKAFRDWPSSISDSRPAALKAWLALDQAEREKAAAEAARYLEAAKTVGRRIPCAFGVYLGEKRWTGLPEPVTAPPADIDAPPFGPVWSGVRMRALLGEPVASPPAASAFIASLIAQDDAAGRAERMKRQALYGWPGVNRMHEGAANRRGIRAAAGSQAEQLGALMEPVPVGSAVFEAWKAEHERRGWPWLPDPGAMRVVYFPAGGPGGLEAFEQALRQGQNSREEGKPDDGARQEAAE